MHNLKLCSNKNFTVIYQKKKSFFNEWYYKFFIFYFVITNEIYVFHKKDGIAQVHKYTIVIPQQLSKKCND